MNEFKEWLAEIAFVLGCVIALIAIVLFIVFYVVPVMTESAVKTGIYVGGKL